MSCFFLPGLCLLQRKSLGGSSSWGSGSLSLFSLCSGAPEEAVADDGEEAAGGAEGSAKGAASSSDIETGVSMGHAEGGKGMEGSGSDTEAAGGGGDGQLAAAAHKQQQLSTGAGPWPTHEHS